MEEILFDKDKFDSLHNSWVKRTVKVPVPELNEMMGLSDDQIIVIEVEQADLSTQLWARAEGGRRTIAEMAQIISDFLRGTATKEELIDLLKEETKLSPDADYQIRLCEKCIVSPKGIGRGELIWLSRYFPGVINRLANVILELSNAGAVKKNLKD